MCEVFRIVCKHKAKMDSFSKSHSDRLKKVVEASPPFPPELKRSAVDASELQDEFQYNDIDVSGLPIIDDAFRSRYGLQPEIKVPSSTEPEYKALRWERNQQIADEVACVYIAYDESARSLTDGEQVKLSPELVAEVMELVEVDPSYLDYFSASAPPALQRTCSEAEEMFEPAPTSGKKRRLVNKSQEDVSSFKKASEHEDIAEIMDCAMCNE